MIIGVDSQNKIIAVNTIPNGVTIISIPDDPFIGMNPMLFKIRIGDNWQEITPAQMVQSWQEGQTLSKGQIIAYVAGLYEVIQTHTSQADWKPDTTPALFKTTVAEGVIPDWKQPTGEHDAYAKGDKVRFNGKVYESLIDANVWSPSVYPAGWKLVV